MRFLASILFSGLVIVLSSCAPKTTDSTSPTRIPTATILFEPITREEAIMGAYGMIARSRLDYIDEPKVVFANEVTLEYVKSQRLASPVYENDDRPGNTKVWFVIFDGMWQVIPPDPEHKITPEASYHGCVFVILDKNRSELGQAACVSKK